MVARKKGILVAQKLLNHTSISTTEKYVKNELSFSLLKETFFDVIRIENSNKIVGTNFDGLSTQQVKDSIGQLLMKEELAILKEKEIFRNKPEDVKNFFFLEHLG